MAKPENQPAQGAPAENKPDGEENEASNLSPEIDGALDKKINAALNSHLTRFRAAFEKDIKKSLGGIVSEQFAPLGEQITALNQRFEQTGTPAGGQSPPSDWEAQRAALERKHESQLAEMNNKIRELETQRNAELEARKAEEQRSALSAALTANGVSGVQQRAAMALLAADRRVGRNEEGNVVFIIPKGGYNDELSLEEGLAAWLKTEEGKAFLPARGVAGSGANGSPANNKRAPKTPAEKKAQAANALAEAMGIQVRTGDNY